MTHSLKQCGGCSKPFTVEDFTLVSNNNNQESSRLVFAACYHIFHQDCLSQWVSCSQKPCPLCRKDIYQKQAGKDLSVYRDIFLRSLECDSDIVVKTLNQSDHKGADCSTCLEKFPRIALRYDPTNKRLYHTNCTNSNSSYLTLKELASIVEKIVAKEPELKKQFTPTSPSSLEKIQAQYPDLLPQAVLGALGLGAFILARPNP